MRSRRTRLLGCHDDAAASRPHGLAIAVPVLVAAVWFLVVAPRARIDLGPVFRLLVEVVIFAAAVTALAIRDRLLLAVVLAVLYVVNRVLMAIWRQ